jgi:predicted O-methyltransferase YrrM
MDLRQQIIDLLAAIPIDVGGGCSASKAYLMASLIRELGTKASVDIGVYRGRSLFPQALAHREYTGGIAYGVDPWSKAEARQVDTVRIRQELDRFVDETDFEAIYRDVESLRETTGVAGHCSLLRMTSHAAAERFCAQGTRFGLVHIDGNHDTAIVLQDVRDFAPLLLPDGVIVLDDVSWHSVRPALNLLKSTMQRLFKRVDERNDYTVLWNAGAGAAVPSSWRSLLSDPYVVSG